MGGVLFFCLNIYIYNTMALLYKATISSNPCRKSGIAIDRTLGGGLMHSLMGATIRGS